MSKSCGSCCWFIRWKKYDSRGLCEAMDASTSAKNKYAKDCEFFKKSKYVKQRNVNKLMGINHLF